jgi:pimeloyl-ACP methyl ester carboxylesterase
MSLPRPSHPAGLYLLIVEHAHWGLRPAVPRRGWITRSSVLDYSIAAASASMARWSVPPRTPVTQSVVTMTARSRRQHPGGRWLRSGRDLASFAAGFLDTRGVGPLDAVRNSVGGAIALRLALADPRRVRTRLRATSVRLGTAPACSVEAVDRSGVDRQRPGSRPSRAQAASIQRGTDRADPRRTRQSAPHTPGDLQDRGSRTGVPQRARRAVQRGQRATGVGKGTALGAHRGASPVAVGAQTL